MVELQVDPVGHDAVPGDCYISVRVGETQKLSKLSASRTYRFPQAGERRYGKIEVFRRIGHCSIDVDPKNDCLREVNVSCEEAGFGTLGLKVAVKQEDGTEPVKAEGEAAAKAKQGSNQKVKAAKEYLAKHSLEVRLSEAMQAVLKERPDDPAEFMAQMLRGHASASSGSTKLPPTTRGLQEKPPEALATDAPQANDARERSEPAEPLAEEAPAAAAAAGPKPAFQRMASVGTWLQAVPAKATQSAGPSPSGPPASVARMPSVATWLKPLPKRRRPQDVAQPVAAAPVREEAKKAPQQAPAGESSSSPGEVVFKKKPSVGTWLMRLPGPEQVPAVAAGAASKPDFQRRPSVGTWMQALPASASAAAR